MLNGVRTNLKILFVGEGEDREKLLNLVRENGLDNQVYFLGQRKDIPQILQLSNGLILPSLYEGLPLCVIEAMAAGKAVVATDVGGTNKLVKNNETGFVVPPKDSKSLALAIENLARLSDKGKRMGQLGKELVIKNYSIKPISAKTADLFCELIK